ncbi:uncharacterized protein [Triticum aestivum]|uniref:uncharacterized protein isoform X1 n=1 Tax=Triticum aestivum TaxID=4565 RepID=UPI001D02EF81|nr:uncharacterized protein LOC123169095 isoform X1 [Triticum aestivum]XP_044442875.1 uncharacterized protein LOC123169095 isoform X1 [Triticum aestivum]XP_044442876.1 uncharacterized protein LOC123169095 isoform X1 [Triticum aestivum]
MSPPSSPEEETSSSPKEQERPSNRPMSFSAATPEQSFPLTSPPSSPPTSPQDNLPSPPLTLPEDHQLSPRPTLVQVPKASNPTEVEAKEVQLSDIAPIMLDDTDVKTKIDDIAELDIAEDFDNRPSKKAKISESRVLEPSPMSPTMKTSSPGSECFESFVPESDNQMNHDTLPSPPSPSSSTISPVFPLHDIKEPNSHKEIKVDETYDYLPQDYTLTDHDLCAHIAIESSLRKQLLVQIDGSSVLQHQLMCLLDEKEWVNDDVINAYICCIKDQIHLQNDNKVYFESPFVTSLFKRDGTIGIQEGSAFMTEIVLEYMQHDMIKLPINANNTHWYLAVVNTKKCEVQVLDSLCWNSDRDDLANTLRGIQFHLDLLKSQKLVSDDWKDVDLTEWKITEQLQKAIQKDSSSCGLFMVKFMEYFTGCALSYPITQEMITSFRFKLASILLCWKTNTAAMTTIVEESDDDSKGDPDDVQILESLDDIKKQKQKSHYLLKINTDH